MCHDEMESIGCRKAGLPSLRLTDLRLEVTMTSAFCALGWRLCSFEAQMVEKIGEVSGRLAGNE